MLVRLKRDWFSPEGTRIRAGVREIPDDLFASLPGDAEVNGKTVKQIKADKEGKPSKAAATA